MQLSISRTAAQIQEKNVVKMTLLSNLIEAADEQLDETTWVEYGVILVVVFNV